VQKIIRLKKKLGKIDYNSVYFKMIQERKKREKDEEKRGDFREEETTEAEKFNICLVGVEGEEPREYPCSIQYPWFLKELKN
jgi:hypothetical protein